MHSWDTYFSTGASGACGHWIHAVLLEGFAEKTPRLEGRSNQPEVRGPCWGGIPRPTLPEMTPLDPVSPPAGPPPHLGHLPASLPGLRGEPLAPSAPSAELTSGHLSPCSDPFGGLPSHGTMSPGPLPVLACGAAASGDVLESPGRARCVSTLRAQGQTWRALRHCCSFQKGSPGSKEERGNKDYFALPRGFDFLPIFLRKKFF